MCLMSGKAKDPMTYEEWRIKDKTAGGDGERSAYDAAVGKFAESTAETATGVDASQDEQEEEIEVAKKTEAQKTAEAKEEALEEQISTLSVPLSSMIKRQDELGVRRAKGKGRRSLLTSSSGGMGYYNSYNT